MSQSLVYRCRTTVGVPALFAAVALGIAVILTRDESGSTLPHGRQGPVTFHGDGSLAEAAKLASLPWPEDGQTAVKIEGAGLLGVRSEQRPVAIASPHIAGDRKAANEKGVGRESTVPVWPGDTFSQRQMLKDHSTYTGASGMEETTRSTAADRLNLSQQVMEKKDRLMLGAVLHQGANTTAGEGLRVALGGSRALIDGLRSRLGSSRSEG